VKLDRPLGVRRAAGAEAHDENGDISSSHVQSLPSLDYFRPNGQPVAIARLVQEWW
jgi:hypothetical protein